MKTEGTRGQSAPSDAHTIYDIEKMDLQTNSYEFEVTDLRYLNLRMELVFKLWPFVSHALGSAWSNIRSICYGLICSMLKVDIKDF